MRRAFAINASSTFAERTIDITTTGRRSGMPRRIEICFYRLDESVYLSGIPATRRRVLTHFVADFNSRHDADSPWPRAVLDDWVAGSPLVRVGLRMSGGGDHAPGSTGVL